MDEGEAVPEMPHAWDAGLLGGRTLASRCVYAPLRGRGMRPACPPRPVIRSRAMMVPPCRLPPWDSPSAPSDVYGVTNCRSSPSFGGRGGLV
ncbi:hypothetical protein CSHISOI_11696 [Colletotrichum shisoi]|uniref:Uncharacterized protein n=1 Tax=Colletotrichum shisoi TaxID=2078593 RepID=A0A5Q4BA54_9PEZI|nr:hypothetical protein CSHISOI_11696 [Colletotrichum shisoi]